MDQVLATFPSCVSRIELQGGKSLSKRGDATIETFVLVVILNSETTNKHRANTFDRKVEFRILLEASLSSRVRKHL